MTTNNSFWPGPEAFLDINTLEQVSDGRVHCTAIAICDGEGNPVQSFYQGDAAHFYYEFETLESIQVPCGGLEFHSAEGLVIHGKNSFQYEGELPVLIEPAQRIRFSQVIHLDVGPGHYWFTVGFASTDEGSYRNFSSNATGHEQLVTTEHCRVVNVASFEVQFDKHGKLRHHGLVNLKGDCQFTVLPAKPGSSLRTQRPRIAGYSPPTIIHVTHWKAGSQWIHKILRECAPNRIVPPKLHESQFMASPIQPGKIYPTVYVTKSQFDRTRLPPNTRRFVVIRDLRDTLVSAYFSMKISHPIIGDKILPLRTMLQQLSQEDGMLHLLNNWLPPCANIQSSWLEAGEILIRYEDLLERDLDILEELLIGRCELDIDLRRFRQVVMDNRFETITKGRALGIEDVQAHERQGAAGDWQRHFTARLKKVFKMNFGGLLVATNYASDLNW